MYLALDPGHTTGYATFDSEGNGIDIGEFNRDELDEFLKENLKDITLIIMEDWTTNPNVRLGGDKMVTVRIIGQIEGWAKTHGIKMVYQPNTIKGIGYRWAGIKRAKNKAQSHRADAYVHGVYYLQKHGIRYPQQGAAK